MKQGKLIRRAVSAALAGCMMFTLSAPALAESTDALMQLSIGSYRSTSLLSEENGLPAITVNGTKVTEANIDSILTGENAGKLSYEKDTNTLKFSGAIKGDLTIDAPDVNVELWSSGLGEATVKGKLKVKNAHDVKVTSEQSNIAVIGYVEISCDGQVEITSAGNTAVAGSVTVKRASEVKISGKKTSTHIVTGNVKIEYNVPVTILNNGTGGMANSITYSGGYVYSATETGTPVDPRITPIDAKTTNAVYITPAVAQAITLTNATVNVPGNMAYAGTQVTATGKAANSKKNFARWKVSENITDLRSATSETATFTMPEGAVEVAAEYLMARKVTVNGGTATKTNTTTNAAYIFRGDEVTVTADIPAEEFDHWEYTFNGDAGKTFELKAKQKTSSTMSFKVPNGNVTLTAVPKPKYAVTVTNGTADKPEAMKGETVTVTPDDRTAEGYQFVRWEVVSGIADAELIRSTTDNTATFTMPGNAVKLWARYNKLYTVTTKDAQADVTTGIPGTEVTVTANVPAGEKFTGWKVECSDPDFKYDESGETVTFKMPKANVTVTAEHKTKRSVTVNGQLAASGLIKGESVTVNAEDYGVSVDKFDHWESNALKLSDADRTNPRLTFTMPDSDVVLRAVKKETYEVVVNNGKANGSSTVDAKPGEEVTITAKDDTEDEVFVGWKVDGGNVTLKDSKKSTTSFIMPHEAVELTAQYETRYDVTVNYQTDGGATTEDATQHQRAIFGTPITVKAADRTSEGLEFDHWEITNGIALKDNEAEEITFDMVRSNVTVTAIYKTLNTISVHDGKAEVKGKEVNKAKEGDEVTITAKERLDEMKRFDHWTVRDNNVTLANEDDAATTFVMGKEAVDLTAEYVDLFKLDVINGSATLAYKGTTYAADGTAAEGDEIKATADPVKDNEHFTGWTVEGDIGLTKDGIELTEDQLKKTEITFDMPKGDVELKANYSYVYDQTVKVVNGTASTDSAAGAEIIATPGETVYIEPEDRMADDLVFTEWEVTSGKGVELKYAEDGTVSFIMPQSDEIVKITAQYAELHAVTVRDGTAKHENGDDLLIMNGGSFGAIAGDRITIKADDKSAEGKVFDHWDVTSNNVSLNDDGSFEMPNEAVEITAVYKNVHTVTVHSEGLAKNFDNIKEGTLYEVTAPEITGKRFSHWVVNLGDVTNLEEKANPGTFTMPDGNVDLTAVYVDLYDLTVTYGTAADANGDLATSAAEGDSITVTANKPYPTQTFEGWTLISGTIHDNDGNSLPMDEEGYILNADGTRLTDRSFTFVMCNDAVELKANYSMPIYVIAQPVTVEGGVAFAEGEAAAAEIFADPGKRITVSADPNADSNMIFDYWEVTSLDEDGKATATLEDATSMTTSFTMPMAPVELTAHWRTIDEAPSGGDGGAGAAIAGVAIGGAAVWGGYEIATRIILNDLLPAGVAIPANRGQLALLIWTEKGKPEPAAQPAFADVADADMAKAAQWCTEQGTMDAKGDRFEPEGWTPKFKVIEVWNKAFPKQ